MLVHTQLEYPFYLSAPHWLAFLLLLALLDGQTGEPRPLPFAKALSLPVAMAAVGALVMAVFARQGRMALTQSERTMLATIDSIEQMPPPAARIYRERKTFDEQSHALLVYNQTRDDALLTGYRQWANASSAAPHRRQRLRYADHDFALPALRRKPTLACGRPLSCFSGCAVQVGKVR